uniref:Astacin domain-containing protein n=1 Tax=Steinernema glaseri TaxID=37863 RepID=A0A1I7ZLS2_9BILA
MRFLVSILFTVVAASLTKRAALNRDNYPDRLFPTDEPIPYKFISDFSSDDKKGVRNVLENIASNTCLSFEDVTKESDAQSNKSTIVFANSTECGAQAVGRRRHLATLYIHLAESECRI